MNGLQPKRLWAQYMNIDIAQKKVRQWFHTIKSLLAMLTSDIPALLLMILRVTVPPLP